MTNLLKKAKELYAKVRTKRVSYERSGISPTRDWQMLLVFTTAMIFIIACVAYYFYREINQGLLFVVTENSSEKEVKIDSVLLKKTVDDIKTRQTLLRNIIQGRSIPSDPSL
jgi:hypothetical protein